MEISQTVFEMMDPVALKTIYKQAFGIQKPLNTCLLAACWLHACGMSCLMRAHLLDACLV